MSLFTAIPNCNSVSPITETTTSAALVISHFTCIHHHQNLKITIPLTILSNMTLVTVVFIVEMPQRVLAHASFIPSPKTSKEITF